MKTSAIIFISILLIAGVFIFRNLGTWLLVSDPLPEKLDIIFTFAGDSKRDVYSKELANKYPKAIWVKSGANGQQYLEGLGKEGFDTSRFVHVDTCTSTWSEINYLHAIMFDVLRSTFYALPPAVFTSKVEGTTSNAQRITSSVLTSNVSASNVLMYVHRKS